MSVRDEIVASLKDRARRFAKYIVANWLPLFSALILGLGLPIWRYYFIDSATLHMEVTGVDMVEPAHTIDPLDLSSLEPVRDLFQSESDIPAKLLTLDEIQKHLDRAKVEATAQQTKITDARKAYEALKKKGDAISARDINDFNLANFRVTGIVPSGGFAPNDTMPTTQLAADARTATLDRIAQAIERADERFRDGAQKLANASSDFSKYRAALVADESQITVDCAVSNSGGGALALKPQALLRVSLGGDNYIDLPMKFDSSAGYGELPAKSSKIMSLKSKALKELSRTDRDQIGTYFRQNTPAQLFIIDIRGNVYRSNIVPFSRGLYEQTVYDTLRNTASKPPHAILASFLR